MFFSYKDKSTLQSMIAKSREERGQVSGSAENMHLAMENLLKCVSFCINEVDCRRMMLLAYFGEDFPPDQCRGTCDNCCRGGTVTREDVTSHASVLLNIVKEICLTRGVYPQVLPTVYSSHEQCS